ncbi:hypothetical protein N8T08_009522 [Aspergillus melleus]|uniref:Uncharacterized protein n=1 Tax=Aspergillus melleus TaxID=138277 RepID=A0ACC3BD31_9EURO|nr:hypothetical protein N8T08_009522 [Aspergillus melleus]
MHHSPVIDEFDIIYDAVSPFWSLSGQEVRDIMAEVESSMDSELWLCTFSGAQATTRCSHPHRTFDRHIEDSFNSLLRDMGGRLPDLKLLVNHFDEPRVLIPPPKFRSMDFGSERFQLTDMSRQPVWDAVTKFCAYQERKKALNSSMMRQPTLPFAADPLWAMDLCQHPEYSAMHGLAISPTSFRMFEGPVPILSTGTLSTMGDILYPSPAYNESEFKYMDSHDVPWEKKWNNLYWAGSTTGGYAVNERWSDYHRQRFVQVAQNLERRQYSYIRERDGVLGLVKSSFLNSRLYNVAFTRVFQCDRKRCNDQQSYFNIKPWADNNEALRSRLVFDTDGNGISGRYHKLLASKSAPLKQTLLHEWHDDRLKPWVHYIPVSQSMEELPELVLYFTSTESGQRWAQEIAEQGREWFAKSFRDVDMTIFMYRLLLELARLQDPRRLAS